MYSLLGSVSSFENFFLGGDASISYSAKVCTFSKIGLVDVTAHAATPKSSIISMRLFRNGNHFKSRSFKPRLWAVQSVHLRALLLSSKRFIVYFLLAVIVTVTVLVIPAALFQEVMEICTRPSMVKQLQTPIVMH